MDKCPKCKGDIKFGVCQICESDTPKEKPVKKSKTEKSDD
jgi:hypothetical protein